MHTDIEKKKLKNKVEEKNEDINRDIRNLLEFDNENKELK